MIRHLNRLVEDIEKDNEYTAVTNRLAYKSVGFFVFYKIHRLLLFSISSFT